jgi:thioredoxin-like negative regulator of GroEL
MTDHTPVSETDTPTAQRGAPANGADTPSGDFSEASAANRPAGKLRIAVMLIVVAVLVGVIAAKVTSQPSSTASTPSAPTSGAAGTASVRATGATITSTHNDASADFKAAILSGKPVYVLFHSLSCQPCVEISAVVDKVMPDYEGKVVFVNAITEDSSAKELATKFKFQYIPTSFFIAPDGKIHDSFTGSMPEADMRTRLDKLAAP